MAPTPETGRKPKEYSPQFEKPQKVRGRGRTPQVCGSLAWSRSVAISAQVLDAMSAEGDFLLASRQSLLPRSDGSGTSALHDLAAIQAAAYEASVDSTCRDTEECNCYWCRKARLHALGVRLTLKERAEEHGLDEDQCGSWIGLATVLRNMGEISDNEWEEMSKDWLPSGSESSGEAGCGTAAAAMPTVSPSSSERDSEQGAATTPTPTKTAASDIGQQGSATTPSPTKTAASDIGQQGAATTPSPTKTAASEIGQQGAVTAPSPTKTAASEIGQQGAATTPSPTSGQQGAARGSDYAESNGNGRL